MGAVWGTIKSNREIAAAQEQTKAAQRQTAVTREIERCRIAREGYAFHAMLARFSLRPNHFLVAPAQAGAQGNRLSLALGSRFRGNDVVVWSDRALEAGDGSRRCGCSCGLGGISGSIGE